MYLNTKPLTASLKSLLPLTISHSSILQEYFLIGAFLTVLGPGLEADAVAE